jgi:hypothetical protein
MGNVDNHRQLPAVSPEDGASCPPNPPNSPTEPSELVPIFFENDFLRAYDTADLSQYRAAYDPFTRETPPSRPFPFHFPLPQIGRITMAERFPKIEDLNLGD